jgi:hypothetical protein
MLSKNQLGRFHAASWRTFTIHREPPARLHRRAPLPSKFPVSVIVFRSRLSTRERCMPYKTASARRPSIICHNANGADAPEAKIPIQFLHMARHIDDLCDHDSLLIIIRCLWWKIFDISHMIHLSEIQRLMSEKRNAHVKKSPTLCRGSSNLKGKRLDVQFRPS